MKHGFHFENSVWVVVKVCDYEIDKTEKINTCSLHLLGERLLSLGQFDKAPTAKL